MQICSAPLKWGLSPHRRRAQVALEAALLKTSWNLLRCFTGFIFEFPSCFSVIMVLPRCVQQSLAFGQCPLVHDSQQVGPHVDRDPSPRPMRCIKCSNHNPLRCCFSSPLSHCIFAPSLSYPLWHEQCVHQAGHLHIQDLRCQAGPCPKKAVS